MVAHLFMRLLTFFAATYGRTFVPATFDLTLLTFQFSATQVCNPSLQPMRRRSSFIDDEAAPASPSPTQKRRKTKTPKKPRQSKTRSRAAPFGDEHTQGETNAQFEDKEENGVASFNLDQFMAEGAAQVQHRAAEAQPTWDDQNLTMVGFAINQQTGAIKLLDAAFPSEFKQRSQQDFASSKKQQGDMHNDESPSTCFTYNTYRRDTLHVHHGWGHSPYSAIYIVTLCQ
jgi:hypothetical protein